MFKNHLRPHWALSVALSARLCETHEKKKKKKKQRKIYVKWPQGHGRRTDGCRPAFPARLAPATLSCSLRQTNHNAETSDGMMPTGSKARGQIKSGNRSYTFDVAGLYGSICKATFRDGHGDDASRRGLMRSNLFEGRVPRKPRALRRATVGTSLADGTGERHEARHFIYSWRNHDQFHHISVL